MGVDRERWFANLPAPCRRYVQQSIDIAVEFSKGEYSEFFQNCGLYAVGSSLEKDSPNDVDIVLVGLDFRAVAEYDKVFLQDPETLIDEEIVIEPTLARELGTTSPFVFVGGPDGLKSMAHSLPEKEDPGNLDDLSIPEQYMLHGMEYGGKKWCYNIQKGMAVGTALNLENYCLRRGKSSRLVDDLHGYIASSFGHDPRWRILTPFEPYFHPRDWFLTLSFNVHTDWCPTRENAFKEEECSCVPLDLIVHAENLHVVNWKNHQEATNFPYIPLHEWPDADKVSDRPVLTDLPHPVFIDPEGVNRVKWDPYFSYLEDTPINVRAREQTAFNFG